VFVDTHCHLDFNSFDDDREQVIRCASDRGVRFLINPGINVESSRKAISLAESYPEVLAAVGVHPNEALTWEDTTLEKLARMADHPRVVAIGEIGLDYYRDNSPKELQVQIFREQLLLAARLELPVIVHNRQATDDVLAILEEWHSMLNESSSKLVDRPGVLHAFSEDESVARSAVNLGFYLGIGGPVTYPKAENLRAVVNNLELAKIVLETDSPFLPPQQHRGERNEPANVTIIAERISKIRKEPLETIRTRTYLNARTLFQW
jgi:TatD DNase family protein